MIAKAFFGTREDGVSLYERLDAKVDENGKFLKDKNDNYVPTGFKIQKVVVTWNGKRIPKDAFYNKAIDVEGAPYDYVETSIPIEASRNEGVQESTETGAGSEHVQS